MALRFKVVMLICVALLGSTVGTAQANLLTNPGAEAGNISGWTSSGGTFGPQVDNGSFNAGINPHSGNFDFLGRGGASGTLTQVVSIVGIPNAQTATISFWEQGLNQGNPSDNGFVSLAFLNQSGTTISTVSSPTIDSHNLTWQQYTGNFDIPTGTVSIAYTMNFIRNVGSDLDSYFDDNDLTVGVVPEPTSLAMIGVGLALIFAAARRKSARAA